MTLDELMNKALDDVSDEQIDQLATEGEREQYRNWYYLTKTSGLIGLEELDQHIETVRQGYVKQWATGFEELDKKLDGGFLGGSLIFLGALSSLGKTSLALQIATNIAERGDDVLIFSLEMSKAELNAKILSRFTYEAHHGARTEECNCCTASDILLGKITNLAHYNPNLGYRDSLYSKARQRAGKLAQHLYLFVGENDVAVDNIRATVKRHRKATGKDPFVIVDYLQILQPSDGTQFSDKRLLTDYDVTTLKTIARDNNVPVLAISAFNRTSYLEGVSSSSFRESSGIEYSSDILLGMQYVGMDYRKHWLTLENGNHKLVFESKQDHENRVRNLADKMDGYGEKGLPIPLELKILKNRLGVKGKVGLQFRPAYNHFEPIDSVKKEAELAKSFGWDSEDLEKENPFTNGDASKCLGRA